MTAIAGQMDLLAELDTATPPTGITTHGLMPDMALPATCRQPSFLRMPPGNVWTTVLAAVDCPDCLAAGDLRAIADRMQGRQAVAE